MKLQARLQLIFVFGFTFTFGCLSQIKTPNNTATESTLPSTPASPNEHQNDAPEQPQDNSPEEGTNPELVKLTLFTESLCPCAAQWIWDFHEHVLPAVGDIITVERYVDGSAKEDGSVSTFHGERELLSQKHEVCVQYLAEENGEDGFLASLQWTACVNGICNGPAGTLGLVFCEDMGSVGSNDGVDQATQCAEEVNLEWPVIDACGQGELGAELHWESSNHGNESDVTYGMQGLPVVWVNEDRISEFWDCNSHQTNSEIVISRICAAYHGNEKPDACN